MFTKFYYENQLANQNFTAKPNIVWVADITEIELNFNKKLYIFLCIDIHTNVIVAHCISRKVITATSIIKCLVKAIGKRFLTIPERQVIIHTDRGTQFLSQSYNKFTKQYEKFFIPSMSRENTPTDKTVSTITNSKTKRLRAFNR